MARRVSHAVRWTLLIATAVALSCSEGGSPSVSGPDEISISKIDLSPSSGSITLGDTMRFTATTKDASGNTLTGRTVTWSSDSTSVATISSTGLVSGVAIGSATITVTSEGKTATALVAVNAPPVATVEVSPSSGSITVGDTMRLTATTKDASGNTLAGRMIAWSSEIASVATVSSTGLVSGVAIGSATITAASEGKTATAQIAVAAATPLSITTVSPVVLIEGEAATILGTGFSQIAGNNQVTIGGISAPVTSSTSTSLSLSVPTGDCLPPRRADLRITVGANSAARMIGVTPRPQDVDLDVLWYRNTYGGNGCLYLPGNAAGGDYLIGVMSISETPSSLTPIALTGTPGDPTVRGTHSGLAMSPLRTRTTVRSLAGAAAPPQPTAIAPLLPPQQGSLIKGAAIRVIDDSRVTSRNIALRRALGPSTLRLSASLRPALAMVIGDTLTLWSGYDRTCASGTEVKAVVRLVGNSTVWLEDTANPSESFSADELSTLDSFYENNAKPVHDSYFGGLSDVNADGRILILMTKEVNKKADAAGWVWFGDLYSTSTCGTSNQAEIFFGWVPDPDGVVGKARTKQEVLDYYPNILTHEITHLVQGNMQVLGTAGAKTTWEVEGGARLAEQLVAYSLFGHGSGQNLGYSQYSTGMYWYWNAWVANLFQYFGWDSSGDGTGRIANAPEECTWIGRVEEGNDGPCIGAQVYGVPAMVLRCMMDRWGGTYPGGETALMKRLTASPFTGFASLTDVSGWRIETILADFYAALWADGRVYNAYCMSSWNLYEILSHFSSDAQLQPRISSSATPQMSANIRGGSNAYLHWTPAGSLAPTAIKVTTGSGAAVPNHIALWALRLR